MPAAPMPAAPRVSLQAIPSYGNAPLSVGFFVNNFSRDARRIASYRFDFGDGTVAALPPHGLFHTYTQPGNYLASVTISTTDGGTATAFKGIIVRPTDAR